MQVLQKNHIFSQTRCNTEFQCRVLYQSSRSATPTAVVRIVAVLVLLIVSDR